MNERVVFAFALLIGSLLLAGVTVMVFWLRPDSLKKIEPLPRAKFPGMLLGWAVLLLCVPYARAVTPDFMLPLLYPLALMVPVLGYFFIDYPFARALGGAMILGSYVFIHGAYAQSSPLLAAAAVSGWIFGLGGIWISGRPCAFRDWLRLIAAKPWWRTVSGLFLGWCSVLLLWMAAYLTGAIK
ncbi:MAG: hypothetical protein PHI35_06195 [Victivallaceae bacterium]|nr:hypothetical protein [Victivallaceae bacterium]